MDARLVQLSRLLDAALASPMAAREAVSSHAGALGEALVVEASASDDVTSPASALDYLETRIDFFGDLVTAEAAATIRARFQEQTANW